MRLIRTSVLSAEGAQLDAAKLARQKQVVELLNKFREEEDTEVLDAIAWDIWNALDSGQKEALELCYEQGPIDDGHWPSKAYRDTIADLGLITRVVVEGDHGPWAVVYPGTWIYQTARDILDKDD